MRLLPLGFFILFALANIRAYAQKDVAAAHMYPFPHAHLMITCIQSDAVGNYLIGGLDEKGNKSFVTKFDSKFNRLADFEFAPPPETLRKQAGIVKKIVPLKSGDYLIMGEKFVVHTDPSLKSKGEATDNDKEGFTFFNAGEDALGNTFFGFLLKGFSQAYGNYHFEYFDLLKGESLGSFKFEESPSSSVDYSDADKARKAACIEVVEWITSAMLVPDLKNKTVNAEDIQEFELPAKISDYPYPQRFRVILNSKGERLIFVKRYRSPIFVAKLSPGNESVEWREASTLDDVYFNSLDIKPVGKNYLVSLPVYANPNDKQQMYVIDSDRPLKMGFVILDESGNQVRSFSQSVPAADLFQKTGVSPKNLFFHYRLAFLPQADGKVTAVVLLADSKKESQQVILFKGL